MPVTTPDARGYKQYVREANLLRSWCIYQLKLQYVPGYIRHLCNISIEQMMPDFRYYLYRCSKDCRLCGFPMVSLRDTTIDHIIPLSLGGPKGITNQQLAHAWCNSVIKGNKLEFDLECTTGFEPVSSVPKTEVLPLDDTHIWRKAESPSSIPLPVHTI